MLSLANLYIGINNLSKQRNGPCKWREIKAVTGKKPEDIQALTKLEAIASQMLAGWQWVPRIMSLA